MLFVLQLPKNGIRYRIEREKFYPGPSLEPGPLALRACPLTTKPSSKSRDPW